MIKFTIKVSGQETAYPVPHENEGSPAIALTSSDGWLSGYFANDKFFGDNDRVYTQVEAWFELPDELSEVSHSEGYLT